MANSACAVNLLEESGTLVSHPASPGDCVSFYNCHPIPTFGVVIARLYVQNLRHFVSIVSEIRSMIWEFWHNFRGTQRICSSHYLFPRGILLAGKNTGVSMSWLGNFVIDRGFSWELKTFSSISTRAGCRNSED